MDDEVHRPDETVSEEGEESRQPTVEDLLALCRDLNSRGAKYVIVGGFAIGMRAAWMALRRVARRFFMPYQPNPS